jgi:hypothetical protein
VTSIAVGLFAGCITLTNVAIPDSVTNIGLRAFSGDVSLTNVTIPNSVISIGPGAFIGCTRLTKVIIGGGLTSIGNLAFAACTKLDSVFFLGNAPTTGTSVFNNIYEGPVVVYSLPGTTGWPEFSSSAEVPVVSWNPLIQARGSSFGLKDNRFGFKITGTPNIPIVVEACTNLANPVWTPLHALRLTNGLFNFSEPFQPDSSGHFYRISSP